MKTTRKVSITIILSAMILSTIIFIAAISSSVEKRKIRAENNILQTTAITTQKNPGYCLREYEGQLAVFRGDSDKPYQKFDVNLNLMSDYDKVLLHDGIFVETQKELTALLEDYLS